MKRSILLFLLGLLAAASTASAGLRLPAIIGDHMVIQQGQPIAIWGWADAGQAVTVTLGKKTEMAMADDKGAWKVSLPALKAGGPYEITVAGGDTLTVRDVLVGDVWLGSGQSNMEFAMKTSHDADKQIPKANHPNIRLFTVEHTTSVKPLDDLKGSWKVCAPDAVKDFSAVAYHFGKEIDRVLKMPVGLIVSCWGGTPAEDWVPRARLDQEPSLVPLLKEWDGDVVRNQTWKTGYDFEVTISDVRFIPKDEKEKPKGLLFKPGGDGFGGAFNQSVKPGSKADFKVADKSKSGSGQAGVFSGLMEGGAWGGVTVPLNSNQPVDLSAYEYVEFYVKGRGEFNMTLGQPSITDWDYYAGDPFKPGKDWQLLKYPIAALKQGGWGAPKPFTPDKIVTMSFNVRPPYWPEVPSIVYNAMIAPLTPAKIKGVLWYQGESNTGRASQYHTVLSALITGWREAWGGPEFPFLIIQLPNYKSQPTEPAESGWAALREAQAKTLDVPNTGLVTTIDLGNPDNIHPTNKTDVGKRAALCALGIVYHKPIVHSGPLFDSMQVKGAKAVLKFKNVGTGLMAGKKLKGFQAAGSDHQFHEATAVIVGKTVVVSSKEVREVAEVRYAWADNPECNLYNKAGLPASPFRASAVQDLK